MYQHSAVHDRTLQPPAASMSPGKVEEHYRPLSIRFGERLRGLRQNRRYTQLQLAVHLGIDRSYLSDVERGKKNMSLAFIEVVAQGFGISMAELLHGL